MTKKWKEDDNIIEKIIVEREYTDEVTHIQVILPIAMREFQKIEEYLKEREEKDKKQFAHLYRINTKRRFTRCRNTSY